MAFIKTLKDKLGNILYPVTREKCIYDDNNVRLDNKLELMKNPITVTSDGTYVSDLNNFKELNKYVGANSTTLNIPTISGFTFDFMKVWNVGFSVGVFSQYLTNGRGETFVRRYVDWVTPQWSGWYYEYTSKDTTSSDTVNSASKLPTSQVTYALGQEIDAINNNLVAFGLKNLVFASDLNSVPINVQSWAYSAWGEHSSKPNGHNIIMHTLPIPGSSVALQIAYDYDAVVTEEPLRYVRQNHGTSGTNWVAK